MHVAGRSGLFRPGPRLSSDSPPLVVVRRRKPRVGADTLHRVAATHVKLSGTLLGRRATAAARLLLMLSPGPGRVHLAGLVGVVVVVNGMLHLLVGGVNASIDAPPRPGSDSRSKDDRAVTVDCEGM